MIGCVDQPFLSLHLIDSLGFITRTFIIMVNTTRTHEQQQETNTMTVISSSSSEPSSSSSSLVSNSSTASSSSLQGQPQQQQPNQVLESSLTGKRKHSSFAEDLAINQHCGKEKIYPDPPTVHSLPEDDDLQPSGRETKSMSSSEQNSQHVQVGTTHNDDINSSNNLGSDSNTNNRNKSDKDSHRRREEGLSLLFAASLLQQQQTGSNGDKNIISIYAEAQHLHLTQECSRSVEESTKTTPNIPLPSLQEPTKSKTRALSSSSGIHNGDDVAITRPAALDVLCGRGGWINQHSGNVIYRMIVDTNKAAYSSVPKRHRMLVSQSIVLAIIKAGGRFLQQQQTKTRSCQSNLLKHAEKLHPPKPSDDLPHAKTATLRVSDSSADSVHQQCSQINGSTTADPATKDKLSKSITWTEINFRRAVQKTSQALRERSNSNSTTAMTAGNGGNI